MTIEAAPGRAVVILSCEELTGYGIDYSEMSLSDRHTRVMLGDMLRLLRHMGILEKNAHSGRSRVTVECARGLSGGCTLFFGIHTLSRQRILRFPNKEQVSMAAKAGAFTEDLVLIPDGVGYILELPENIEWWREGLLLEFAEEIRAE